eukprot:TRINITY_DN28772_c0_g1_i1.p1 TRINITY_DN28772_c0_g1~~TRINITY_DN28772_c0_g1_i1.p1  ORF type:complete len:306 (+),score=71.01 TRINITY_DN28772_c0_g1_i1:68-985(+)
MAVLVEDFAIDLALGAGAAAAAKTIVTPIDKIMTTLRTQELRPGVLTGEVGRHKGFLDCGRQIYYQEGWKVYWRGMLGESLARYVPLHASTLAFKDGFRYVLPLYSPRKDFWSYTGIGIVAGMLAAASSYTVLYPLDCARARMAADAATGRSGGSASSVLACIQRTMSGPGGIAALYTGFGASAGMFVTTRGLQLGLFDSIAAINRWRRATGPFGVLSTLLVAQVSVAAGAALTYPLHTALRRQEEAAAAGRRMGTWQTLKTVAIEDGFLAGGLYRGFIKNLKLNTSGALLLMLYDRSKFYLGLA